MESGSQYRMDAGAMVQRKRRANERRRIGVSKYVSILRIVQPTVQYLGDRKVSRLARVSLAHSPVGQSIASYRQQITRKQPCRPLTHAVLYRVVQVQRP